MEMTKCLKQSMHDVQTGVCRTLRPATAGALCANLGKRVTEFGMPRKEKPGSIAAPGLVLRRQTGGGEPLPILTSVLQADHCLCTTLISATLPLPWQTRHCSVLVTAALRGS